MKSIKDHVCRLRVNLAILVCTTFFGCSQSAALFCEGIDCSGRGTCFENEDSFVCICEEGYVAQGPNCVLDEADADLDGDSGETPDTDHGSDSDVNDSDDSDVEETPDSDVVSCPTTIEFGYSYATSFCPVEPQGIAFSDFTGDEYLDLVVSGNRSAPKMNPSFCLFTNDPYEKTRRFRLPTKFQLRPEETVGTVAVGNLDSDEAFEIINFLSSTDKKEGPGLLHITHDPETDEYSIDRHSVPYPLTYGDLVDLDGDDFVDIAALSTDGSTPDGRLIAWQRISDDIPTAPASVTELDLQPNKLISFDTNPELEDGHEIAISFRENSRLDLFTYNVDAPNFEKVGEIAFGSTPFDMAAADFDGDELVEIVVATGPDGLQRVEIGEGSTFGTPVLLDDSREYLTVTTADIDQDDDEDILAFDGDLLVVFCNHHGEFNIIDEIPHNASTLERSVISTVLLDDNPYPDIIISAYSLFTYYNH